MIDRLKASPAWENLLVVLVADHGYPYPRTLAYNEPLRHRIPMIWTGGAVAGRVWWRTTPRRSTLPRRCSPNWAFRTTISITARIFSHRPPP